jgi:hypothetical protein
MYACYTHTHTLSHVTSVLSMLGHIVLPVTMRCEECGRTRERKRERRIQKIARPVPGCACPREDASLLSIFLLFLFRKAVCVPRFESVRAFARVRHGVRLSAFARVRVRLSANLERMSPGPRASESFDF